MDENLKAQLIKAKSDVLDRMVAVGWVSQVAALCQPTERGHAIVQALRNFIFFGGRQMTPVEFTAFCDIIRNLEYLN